MSSVVTTEDVVDNIADVLFKEEQVECPLKHHFSDGVYVREITMPKDTIVLGHIHKTRHLNIISKGSCILSDIHTGELTTIVAPYTFESDAGVSKLLYIVEECIWSTVHVTEETDVSKLEEELVHNYNDERKIGGITNEYDVSSNSRSRDKHRKLNNGSTGSSRGS